MKEYLVFVWLPFSVVIACTAIIICAVGGGMLWGVSLINEWFD